jgi:putative acetyltransferase
MPENKVELREELAEDRPAIAEVVTAAFAGSAEAALVAALRDTGALTISLVAVDGPAVVGHVVMSPVEVEGVKGGGRWLGLAPLAVHPDWQRQGIGRDLVRHALDLARERGVAAVFVLGKSRYYAPLGFAAAAPLGWRCTYDAPSTAFRVCRLADPGALPPAGTVHYHPAFDAL